MAVPKKKVSKSRRNMRRFSVAYRLDTVTIVKDPETGESIRPHSVSRKNLETQVAAYVARKQAARKAPAKSAAKASK